MLLRQTELLSTAAQSNSSSLYLSVNAAVFELSSAAQLAFSSKLQHEHHLLNQRDVLYRHVPPIALCGSGMPTSKAEWDFKENYSNFCKVPF